MMKRRKFAVSVVRALAWLGSFSVAGLMATRPASASGSYPIRAFRSGNIEEILLELFETTHSGEDGGLEISIASEAVNPRYIPFRITARSAEKVAIFAENNTHPLVLVSDTTNYPEGVIIGTLALEEPSVVSCYVLRQGYLYKNSRHVALAAAGYKGD